MQKEILSFSKMHVDGDLVITATQDELLLKDGKVLKDTMSGLWNVTLGYSNNNIKQAMMNQLVKLPYSSNFSGYHSETTEKYAEEICKRTNMSRVYFTNSGSAAVETAIKLTGKEKPSFTSESTKAKSFADTKYFLFFEIFLKILSISFCTFFLSSSSVKYFKILD